MRATLLSLTRSKIAEIQHAKLLELQWVTCREKNQLDLDGKVVVSEFRARDCG